MVAVYGGTLRVSQYSGEHIDSTEGLEDIASFAPRFCALHLSYGIGFLWELWY